MVGHQQIGSTMRDAQHKKARQENTQLNRHGHRPTHELKQHEQESRKQ
jgi:hypothetical protein